MYISGQCDILLAFHCIFYCSRHSIFPGLLLVMLLVALLTIPVMHDQTQTYKLVC